MIDLAELRRLAEACEPKEWEWMGFEGQHYLEAEEAAFISHSDPATVLALLDRLESAEAQRDRLQETLQKVHGILEHEIACRNQEED